MSPRSPGPRMIPPDPLRRHRRRIPAAGALAAPVVLPSFLRRLPPWTATGCLLAAVLSIVSAGPAAAQLPIEGEVRQIVAFTLQPGAAGAVRTLYRDEVIPLYAADPALRSLRIFAEAESPVPVDLVVVRAFEGMAGMDASGAALRRLAEGAGTSVGALYGRIAALATGHADEFVRMLPELGHGDPAGARLTAFVRYRIAPGQGDAFEAALAGPVLELERTHGWGSSTARYLLGDGWSLLRMVGVDSLAGYQAHVEAVEAILARRGLAGAVVRRSDQLLVALPELEIR